MKNEDTRRFWKKVKKSSGCWNWIPAKDQLNYGKFRFNGKIDRPHRVSFIIRYGKIPAKLCVLHKCDKPSCVNPRHLFLGTRNDNILDMVDKGRQSSPKGEAVSTCMLTKGKVLHIRRSLYSNAELSRIYNVSATTIKRIRDCKSWKHI